MARLTTSSSGGGEKKEEFSHPLAVPLNTSDSHPLASSNRLETTDCVSSTSGEQSILMHTVELKDDQHFPTAEVDNKPQQQHETARYKQKNVHQAADLSLPMHTPSSSFKAKHKQMSQLPRSVRWRLSLGVLTDPFDGEDIKDDTGGNNSEESSSKPSCIQQMVQQDKANDKALSQLKTIEEVNALKLRFQRSRYEELEKRHYWSHTPVGIAGKTDNSATDDDNKADAATTTTQHVAKGDDPLSALLENGQEDKGSLFGFGAKRKGKRVNAINNNSVHSTSTKSTKSNNEKESPPSAKHNAKDDDDKRDKSKWADFYSTREMLDVIEKDLNRLPTDHYTMYHSWRKQCMQCRGETSTKKNDKLVEDPLGGSDRDGRIPSVQPQRQTNVTLRKRFANTGLGQSLNLGRDRKLLASTLEDDDEEDEVKKAEAAEKLEIETSTKERAQMLSQLLFVYGQEHEDIGYRQGMHEILSYILLALEMDLMELAVAKEKKKWKLDFITGNEDDDNHGGKAGVDSSGNIVVVRLLDPEFIVHDAFTIFECVMDALASAYDVVEGNEGSSAGCLEAMTSSIVSKIRYVARDEALFSHVLYMPVPPQLYFAKWVRLMFGREVAGGMHAVMELWDAFFELASATASMDDDMSLSDALMNVLKTAAAAMILLIRHLLLAPTVAWDGSLTGDPDPNDGIQYLMNYPPIEDTGVFVKTVTSLLAKEKMLTAQSSQKEDSGQRVKARRYQPMTSNEPIIAIEKQPVQSQRDEEDAVSQSSSNGGFMGWPSESGENKLGVSLTIATGPEIPMSRDHSSMIGPDLETHELQDHKLDISETLGNFASGLLGLASKSVDAAATTLATQKQRPRGPDRRSSFGRLSFTGRRRSMSGNDNDDQKDFVIDTHRPTEEERSDYIQVFQADINNDTNKESRGPVRRRSMSNESVLSDASCTTFSSRLTASRSLSESCRQDPAVLAKKLERSVSTLMKHFHEQMRAQADVVQDNNSGIPPPLSRSLIIPEEIWHAMADIDQVRKDLLSRSATEKLERSSSRASLLGIEQNNEK